MSTSLAHCITQKNHFFNSALSLGSRSHVLVHRHVYSTELLSHCITQESHMEFLVNSSAQRRLIHHLHFCSHDDAPITLGFHTFTLCSATGTSNYVDLLSHCITQENHLEFFSTPCKEEAISTSCSVSDRNHTPLSDAFSQVCKLENISHSCNDQHLSGL